VKKEFDTVDVAVVDTPSSASRFQGTMTGILVGFAAHGVPLIEVSGVKFHARSCSPILSSDIGHEVVVAFDASRAESPIVVGVIRPTEAMEFAVDGEKIVLTGHQSITLKCGEASITLDSNGKVVIRGANVVSHASGVNRIRGGSVELN
jgi:uncharacterized protein DUF6484